MAKVSLPLRIGISSCLLGQSVRWDGGHKRDRYINQVLADYFEWVPVCPEFEVGMGVPREPVRLVGTPEEARLVGRNTGTDWTARMRDYARGKARELEKLDLSGYLLKSDSPTCGMERVKVYSGRGAPTRKGIGLFARELSSRLWLLPVEEEGRLNDARLRENFIERVFAYRRWRVLVDAGCRRGDLVLFHTIHKFLILAHSPSHYQKLGRLVARARDYTPRTLGTGYGRDFMAALRRPATMKGHFNVLQHLSGFLKGRLDPLETEELHALLEEYRRGWVPLVVPLTLLRHHVRRQGLEYLRDQVYLNPHPHELMLRNHP